MRERARGYAKLSAAARAVGFKTDVIVAAFRGGKCGLCDGPIPKGEAIVGFRDVGWCHIACTTALTTAEYAAETADISDAFEKRLAEVARETIAKFKPTRKP